MRVPSYRRKSVNGVDYARVTLNGREHVLGKYDTPTSRQKYDELIADWLHSKRSKEFGRTSDDHAVMAMLLSAYSKWAMSYYRESTEWANIKPIARILWKDHGEVLLDRFGVQEYLAIREKLMESPVLITSDGYQHVIMPMAKD